MFIKLWRSSAALALAVFFAIFLLLPVGTVIAEGCSWKVFAELWENPVYRGGMINSLALALFTTLLVFLLALPLAILSDSYDFKGKGFWNAMILAPMILPPFVGALGFQQVFGYYGVLNTILTDLGFERIDFLGGSGKFYAIAFILLTPAMVLSPLMIERTFGNEVWRLTANEILWTVGSLIGGVFIALRKQIKNKVFDKNNWRIPNDLKNIYNLETIEKDEYLKEKYYDTLFYKIIQTETKSVKQDLIVTFCFKYFDYNKSIRNNQIDRAKKSIETNNVTRKGKNQNDYRRFIETQNSTDNGEVAENISYSINQELIDEESKYDGYYALTTNLVGDINEIFKIVKGRWEIEESFRIMKSDFLARPVNLSREDRIKAHFMTCFISLFIYRLLEKKLDYKYTTSQILNTLRNMNMLEQKGLGFEPEYERTQLTDDLHELFNFNTDLEIVSYKKMKKIFKSIL